MDADKHLLFCALQNPYISQHNWTDFQWGIQEMNTPNCNIIVIIVTILHMMFKKTQPNLDNAIKKRDPQGLTSAQLLYINIHRAYNGVANNCCIDAEQRWGCQIQFDGDSEKRAPVSLRRFLTVELEDFKWAAWTLRFELHTKDWMNHQLTPSCY